jgi:GH24 family phage-related lysozyme (muramidase)
MGRIIYDTFDPVDVDDVRDFVTGNEGNRSWMYGDGRGFVTIGFGHLVENLGEAQGLNLANKDTGGAATADEVEHDFGAAQTGTSNIADDYEAGSAALTCCFRRYMNRCSYITT